MHENSFFDGACRLHHWGLIRASGPDAGSFLHSQLTNDVANLGAAQVRLAGYCSAKGRLLASFIVWKATNGDLLLACSADLLAATLKRLRMYVLRARCTLSDVSAELPLYGLAGAAATTLLGEPIAVWHKAEQLGHTAIRLPDVQGHARCLCASSEPLPLRPLDREAWDWLEVRSGIARIEQATVEQFVPQMLNYEILGGVDFHKGCYPGQEVVARSQYRGTIKRRSLLFETAGAAMAGQDVSHSEDPTQPAGKVVNAATQIATTPAGCLALVELKLAALGGGVLRLGAIDGPTLRRVELPYAVPQDSAEAG